MKFGFIGTGNMGGAIAKAVCRAVRAENVTLFDADAKKAKALAQELGCGVSSAEEIAEKSKFIILGVKPQVLETAIDSIKNILSIRKDSFVAVSMAAGTSIEKIEGLFGFELPVIRIMPNTPVALGKGMTLYSANELVKTEEYEEFVAAMSQSGCISLIPEKLIDAASAVSGCGPAFVYMFIEALADGGVKCGLPRDLAQSLATHTVMGAGAMVEETRKHPGELKDMVCSPGGTTIEGVGALENGGFRGTVMKAVHAAYEKNSKL